MIPEIRKLRMQYKYAMKTTFVEVFKGYCSFINLCISNKEPFTPKRQYFTYLNFVLRKHVQIIVLTSTL